MLIMNKKDNLTERRESKANLLYHFTFNHSKYSDMHFRKVSEMKDLTRRRKNSDIIKQLDLHKNSKQYYKVAKEYIDIL